MKKIIETKRCVLRPFSQEDALELFSYRSDKQTNQFQSWIPNTIDDAKNFITKLGTEFNKPDTWFQFALLDKNRLEIIGDIGIHFIDEEGKQVELGITLAKDKHGLGYASEALQGVIDCLFSEFDKHRITTSVDPNNKASMKLMERLGFRKEAHHIESYFDNGKWVDDVIFALLKREWKI